jgi:hypothetical protein
MPPGTCTKTAEKSGENVIVRVLKEESPTAGFISTKSESLEEIAGGGNEIRVSNYPLRAPPQFPLALFAVRASSRSTGPYGREQ